MCLDLGLPRRVGNCLTRIKRLTLTTYSYNEQLTLGWTIDTFSGDICRVMGKANDQSQLFRFQN